MNRIVLLFLVTFSGAIATLFAQEGGVSIETYQGLYQVGGILYYNPPTEEGTPGQMTATTHYQGGGDPFSDPNGSADPLMHSNPLMYSEPSEGGDPYGEMDPSVGVGDPYSDPFGGMDPSMEGSGESETTGGISVETYQGLFQVNGILYYNPPETGKGATTHYQPGMEGGGDPFSDPNGSTDPSTYSDPSMYSDPGGSEDPYNGMAPSAGGSNPYSDPTTVDGSDPYSDPFGGSDPEVNGTAARVSLRLPYTFYQ